LSKRPRAAEHVAPEQGPGAAPALADVLRVAAVAWQMFRTGRALDRAISEALSRGEDGVLPRMAPAVKDVAYTAARRLALIEAIIGRLTDRPPSAALRALLAVSIGQLLAQRHGAHTVVDQAVRAAQSSRGGAAGAHGFVNAVLRNVLRHRAELEQELNQQDSVRYNAPPWWIDRLRAAYPAEWRTILDRGNEPPPLVLRVNTAAIRVAEYLERLGAQGVAATRVGPQAVWLHDPVPVTRIEGFAEGVVSVQDAGAQLAAQWLGVAAGQRVLDACAAPGGKTGQLAEMAPLQIDAVDVDRERCARIEQNLARLGSHRAASVHVRVADLADPQAWTAGRRYDRILLDAPCTASGIVRRHPDIPWLRRPADVAQLATQQRRLLQALWPLLRPTGRLLYIVCSLFPEEGAGQIDGFLRRHPDARLIALPGQPTGTLQLLPTAARAGHWSAGLPTLHDGFFLALVEKRPDEEKPD
jgi:16S rRNA (cytosine967-C5)-methyltransferase